MDSSSSAASSQNWLAFSLSHPHHHNHYPPTSDDPVSLYHHHQTFNTTTSTTNHHHHSIDSIQPDSTLRNDITTTTTTTTCPLDLSMFSNNNNNNGSSSVVYDSELKSIAASFLRGYSSSMSTGNNTSSSDHHIDNSAIVPVTAIVPVDSSKKAVDTFGQRTSIYRGVTRHRWTGRYEAHLWDNSCRREGQSRKGRQVYLGGYDKEEKAARAYDLAALKYWGPTTTTNFPVCNYEKELDDMKNMTRQEFVASLRRKSSGFSRGASIYRGVTRHHQHGRWQARIGRVAGNKDLYLGTFSTQEEAAEAYDIAAIKFRGLNAVTNFDMSRYDVKSIASSSLPIGGITSKPRASSESDNKSSGDGTRSMEDHPDVTSVSFASPPSSSTTTLSFGIPVKQDATDYWSLLGYQNPLSQNNPSNKNNSNALFQSCLTNGSAGSTYHSSQNMDYSTNSDYINQTRGVLNGGGYVQQQQQQQSTSIPFVTPISVSSSNSSYDNSTSYGSWVTPSVHAFQTGKPNISVYQTPIYGME
ncbi:hypothetical protein AQUCO_09600025v1 [Aquilegia coerulea]|uniref:AP2/ERF domain-containing protein n=1 Tax=Aquilegia coerulea TaxID=218851 RepID=A0A2G5C4G0_AQUCA|nr:hypothetical protein AQUCO_09600025v1 [Aquilegia coerulea]